jgi:hypothetical protein
MLIDKYPPGMMVNFLMLIGRAWNVRNGVNEEKLLVVFFKKEEDPKNFALSTCLYLQLLVLQCLCHFS